jgi:hypothetical protein
LIQEERTVDSVRDAILEEYEVDLDQCEKDLMELLQRLVDEGLVVMGNGRPTQDENNAAR